MPHEPEFQDLSATNSFVASADSRFDETCIPNRLDETADGIDPRLLGHIQHEPDVTAAGVSLASWLQQQQVLAWRQTADVVLSVADSLAANHSRGVFHGAIRPEAIRCIEADTSRQRTWTLDFGDDASRESVRRATLVGPCWAPEQIQARGPIDSRCDVYAVGVVLYWMLCHRYPFRASDQEDLRREILEDAPQPPRQLAHGIPVELERLCLRLLSKSPAARPVNGEQLAAELRQVIAQTESIDLSGTEVSANSATLRKALADSRDVELLLVLKWEPSPATPRLQDLLRDNLEQRHGTVLSQTPFETVARLAPSDGLPPGMPTLLDFAITFLSGLKLTDSEVNFSVDSAESETLRHRAPRLSGRVSARGLELTPQSLDVMRRWLPSSAVDSTAAEIGGPCLPLMGRASQLAILKARWEQAREGMGQIVLLIGDEGTGKTRLVQELRAAASSESLEWICWTCRPGPQGHDPHPAVDYFRHRTRQSPGEDPDATRITGVNEFALSEAEFADLTAVQNRERWQPALVAWLKRMAAARPVVFVVEDLQWVDPATLAFLHTLLDLGLHERVLTILTCRPEFETPWGSRAHQTQVALSRLTRRHAASIFSAITGLSDPPQNLTEELLAATDGIPLFVVGFANSWPK